MAVRRVLPLFFLSNFEVKQFIDSLQLSKMNSETRRHEHVQHVVHPPPPATFLFRLVFRGRSYLKLCSTVSPALLATQSESAVHRTVMP